MAGTANEIINVRERPLSSDLNDLQSLLGRDLLDLLRFGQSLRTVGNPADATRNVVLGGLVVSPSGSDVSVSIGALLQNSASLVPTPGAFDSTYRLGVLRTAFTQTMPAPGGTTYYLLEAQMEAVTIVTASRDILNPTTGVFAAASVPKVEERQVQFQLLTGGASAPAPSGGDWVPIAIIRRPGGGGAVVATDIIDVRPLAEWGRERPTLPTVLGGSLNVGTPGLNTIALKALIDGAGGLREYDLASGTVDISAAAVIATGLVLAANTWYYLYLAPWSAQALNVRQTVAGLTQSGVLVLSDSPPDQHRRNTVAIPLPAPFSVTNAPISSAYLVGAVRRNAANTLFVTTQSTDLRDFYYLGGTLELVSVANLSPPSGNDSVTPITIPAGVSGYVMSVDWTGGAGAVSSANSITVTITPTGSTGVFGSRFGPNDGMDQIFDMEIPVLAWGSVNFRFLSSPVPNAGSSAACRLARYRYV